MCVSNYLLFQFLTLGTLPDGYRSPGDGPHVPNPPPSPAGTLVNLETSGTLVILMLFTDAIFNYGVLFEEHFVARLASSFQCILSGNNNLI